MIGVVDAKSIWLLPQPVSTPATVSDVVKRKASAVWGMRLEQTSSESAAGRVELRPGKPFRICRRDIISLSCCLWAWLKWPLRKFGNSITNMRADCWHGWKRRKARKRANPRRWARWPCSASHAVSTHDRARPASGWLNSVAESATDGLGGGHMPANCFQGILTRNEADFRQVFPALKVLKP